MRPNKLCNCFLSRSSFFGYLLCAWWFSSVASLNHKLSVISLWHHFITASEPCKVVSGKKKNEWTRSKRCIIIYVAITTELKPSWRFGVDLSQFSRFGVKIQTCLLPIFEEFHFGITRPADPFLVAVFKYFQVNYRFSQTSLTMVEHDCEFPL